MKDERIEGSLERGEANGKEMTTRNTMVKSYASLYSLVLYSMGYVLVAFALPW